MANARGRSSSSSSSAMSAEALDEALPPAGVAQLPAELALGLVVRGADVLGHGHHGHLASGEAPDPTRHPERALRTDGSGEHRQEGGHGCGFVVDDVVDARRSALDGGDGGGGGVLDVDEGPDAGAPADDGELTLAEQLD